jgi:hypothetical protein
MKYKKVPAAEAIPAPMLEFALGAVTGVIMTLLVIAMFT